MSGGVSINISISLPSPQSNLTDKRYANVTTKSTLITLDVINIIFQSFCCYILFLLYKKGTRNSCNQLFLLNLAFSELYANVVLSVRDVFNLSIELRNDKHVVRKIFWCLNVYFVTGVSYIYILAMCYVTGK